jgi:uncharacterized surface protein with fasciclin (FAS1) repeats
MADIVETAKSAGSFSKFLQAAQAAGLIETLKGRGPYTLFAPNDDAFAKLPAKALQTLLSDKGQLTRVLTYHVVPGKVTASELSKMHSLKTMQGQPLNLETSNGLHVGGAQVVNSNVEADNGLIHVIDTVIMPKA